MRSKVLLAIKRGEFSYDTLTARAEALMQQADTLFGQSTLPEHVNRDAALAALVRVREDIYCGNVEAELRHGS